MNPLATRRCMVCRKDLLKGFFKTRISPICIDCTNDVNAQRTLLRAKYRAQDRARQLAARQARKLSASAE